MTFKEKVVKLRKLKGMTQDEFASAVGVSRQAVYKWESGQSYPEVAKLLEMKVLFNISIDDLLDDNYEVIVPEKKKKKRLPKEVKREIEEAVVSEMETAQTEPVAVAAFVEKEEAVNDETVLEAPADIPEAPKAEDVTPEEPKESSEKKVGFFGRLFGRR